MPEDREENRPPFEEQAAQRELERLHRAIEETRGRRRRANEEFDRFLKSFDERPSRAPLPPAPPRIPAPAAGDHILSTPPPPGLIVPPRVPPPGTTAPVTAAPVTMAPETMALPPPVTPAAPARDPGVPQPAAERPEAVSIPAALSSPEHARVRLPYGVGAGVVVAVVLAVAVVAWRGRGGEQAAGEGRIVPAQGVSAAAPVPTPTSGSEKPPPAELVTTRRVWMRVSVDGARMMEREVAENTRIPLQPTSRIVVRAGDAGAVRVLIDGKDLGPVGPDGQVVTRAYPVPATR